MALEWKDRYRMGDSEADADHQEWFRLANKFLMSNDAQSMHESGEAFIHYTRHHFFHEESFMRALQYPLIATHVQAHEMLVSTLIKIWEVGKVVLSKEELHEFVGYCLVKHIDAYDAPLVLYGRRNGATPPDRRDTLHSCQTPGSEFENRIEVRSMAGRYVAVIGPGRHPTCTSDDD
jgi:hemerythrin-like metal-binding protein